MPIGKRPDHAGTISSRPRPDGRWEARLTLPDGRRKTLYGKTWEEAEGKLNAARAELERGALAEPGKATIAQLWSEYVALNPSNLRRSTMESRKSLWSVRIEPIIGKTKLRGLSATHIQRVLSTARDNDLSDSTLRAIHATLASLCDYGVQSNRLAANPADRVKVPAQGEPRDLPITTAEQITALMDAIQQSRYRVLFMLGVGLGLRVNEACALRWRDVDFDRGVVHIRHGVDVIDGETVFTALKTKASRRDLPLPAFVADELRAEKRRQAERRLRLGPEWRAHDLVGTWSGRPVARSMVWHAIKRIGESTGIDELTFHHLRHLCATVLMLNNVPPRIVQGILGHSSSATTMRIYQHVNTGALQEAADVLNAAFSGAIKRDQESG